MTRLSCEGCTKVHGNYIYLRNKYMHILIEPDSGPAFFLFSKKFILKRK